MVTDGRARETMVETGSAVGDLIELRGVEVGKKVVLKPRDRIADGVALRVEQK